MGYPSRSMEDNGTEGDLNYWTLLPKFQRRRILVCFLEIIFMILSLVKNVVPLCPCPKSVTEETKVKTFELIPLAEKNLKTA